MFIYHRNHLQMAKTFSEQFYILLLGNHKNKIEF